MQEYYYEIVTAGWRRHVTSGKLRLRIRPQVGERVLLRVHPGDERETYLIDAITHVGDENIMPQLTLILKEDASGLVKA